jgi:hypothetical protein
MYKKMKNAIGTTKITVTMSKATILDRTFCCVSNVFPNT